jgi:hypothetical protein
MFSSLIMCEPIIFLEGTSKVNAPFLLSKAQYFLNCQCGSVDFNLYPFSYLKCNYYILIDTTTLFVIQAGLLQRMADKIPDPFLLNTISHSMLLPKMLFSFLMMICY